MFLEGTRVYFGTGADCLNFLPPKLALSKVKELGGQEGGRREK
jgi:hypothetical protein